MFTITHCEKYAEFESAEGGYYYECWEPTKWVTVKSLKSARKWFNRFIKEYGYTKINRFRALDDEALTTRYIGEGCFISIKKSNMPDKRGYQIYC